MNSREALPYQHQPLSDASKAIRLLTLLQDPLNSPIRCELLEVNFPTEQTYTALSYVWGPPDTGYDISINDQPLKIRKNLNIFLLKLRSRLSIGQTLTLWADAICIDQASTPEKNYQVRMMGEIYSNAGDVKAWLGEDGRIERLFCSLEDYQTALTRLPSEDANQSDCTRRERDTRMQAFLEYREFGQDLLTFYSAEYFHRAWIIQELILAPSLSLMCGSSCLTHYGLITLFNHLRYQRVMTGRTKVDHILCHYLDSKVDISHVPENQFALNELIKEYAYTQCSDPHDKIYAFIGTAKDLRRDFIVDYDKPLQFLLMDTILHDLHGRSQNLTNYFGITYALYSSDLYSDRLYYHDDFPKKAVWASQFVKMCQQTLPPLLLCARLAIQPSLVGRVASVDGVLASGVGKEVYMERPRKKKPLACHIINGGDVLVGDLVCQELSLCFIYRWCDPHVRLVATGIAAYSEFSRASPATLDYVRVTYTNAKSFDTEENVAISTNKGFLAAVEDWHSYCNSTVTERLDISIAVSDLLVMLQADFPNFVQQGGAAMWT